MFLLTFYYIYVLEMFNLLVTQIIKSSFSDELDCDHQRNITYILKLKMKDHGKQF